MVTTEQSVFAFSSVLGSISLLSRCFNTGRGEASERSEEAGGEGKKKEEEVAGRTRN